MDFGIEGTIIHLEFISRGFIWFAISQNHLLKSNMESENFRKSFINMKQIPHGLAKED